MSEIVKRLREYRMYNPQRDSSHHPICDEAAARIERLEKALRLIDSVSVHSGGDIHGVNPKQWEAAFKEVQAIARAALEDKS